MDRMITLEVTTKQAEALYLAISEAQNRLTDTATDEEYEAYDDLLDLISDAL